MEIQDKRIDDGKAFDWGKTSKEYAKFRDIYPEEFYRKVVDRGLCVNGQKVLNLGTGTGVIPRNMYKYSAQWTGTDISPEQIEQAKMLAADGNMKINFIATATENPEKKKKYAGPPSAFCSDFAMWFWSPLFKPLMGMDSNALKLILPMKQRKSGILFDGAVSNTDMSNYPVEYNLSKLEVPVLIIHSKDDKLADFEKVEPWISAIKDCTFVPLESGGHLMEGNRDFVEYAVCEFIEVNK